ncbi:hypothetical protein CKAH01_16350 [Colletotrichum kahawae]|uniref:Uncharacterized protein n=1 Tax=Colletotrichum kahawae TaxID=34407 RepID=A0AAE0D6X2_COLKA|nr:hypothetical protein CKAH01_16350 [Colletotrichum kahawae]
MATLFRLHHHEATTTSSRCFSTRA